MIELVAVLDQTTALPEIRRLKSQKSSENREEIQQLKKQLAEMKLRLGTMFYFGMAVPVFILEIIVMTRAIGSSFGCTASKLC